MRVTCPQCQSGYDVDPEKIPVAGLSVRCPHCTRVFPVRKLDPVPLPGRAPPAPPPQDADFFPAPEVVDEPTRAVPLPPPPGGASSQPWPPPEEPFELPEPLSFGEVPLDDELEMLFAPGDAPPAAAAQLTESETRWRVRRSSGRIFGPFAEPEIAEMLAKGELLGNEDIAPASGEDWIAIGSAAPFAAAVKRMNDAPLVPPLSSGAPQAEGFGTVPAPFQPRMQGGFREKQARKPIPRRWLVVAGVLLLVAGVGAGGALTRHGPFFWKILRSRSDSSVARLAAEGRKLLAQDAFPSDQGAMRLAEQGLARRGDDPEGIRLFTSASAALGSRGAEAMLPRARQLSAALTIDSPDSLDAREAALAVALAAGEDTAAAAAALEKVLPASPDSETLFLLARAALARGDLPKAQAVLDRLDGQSPGSVRAARLRAALLVKKGDDPAARTVLEGALAREPAHAAAALDLAALQEKAGEPGAEAALRALLARDRLERLGPSERARARVLLAGLLSRAGDVEAAEVELAQAAQDWAGANDARLALARSLLRRGELVKAAAVLESIPAPARSAAAWALLVRAQTAAGKGAEVAASLDAAQARFPDDPDLLIARGLAEQRAGKGVEARKTFGKAADKAPTGWQAPLALARLSAAEGDLAGAEAQLKIATERGPAEPDVLAAQASLAFARGDTAGAEEFFARALALDPRNAPALAGSARLALARGDLAGARPIAERAVAADPGSAEAQLVLGWVLWRSGEPEPARKALEAALALDPRGALARVRLGALLLEQKRTDEAMKHLDQATSLDARLAEAQFWLGKALLVRGETASALERLRQATRLAPGEAAYQVQLGEVLERSGQVPEAVGAYRAAISAAPRSPDGLLHLGRLFASQGDCRQAMPWFQKAIEVAPDPELARIELAGCQLRSGRAAEAVATYQKVLRGDPKRVEVYYLLARAVHEAQGLRQAVPWYEKAAVAEPGNPMPHLYLGYWHKERGQRAQAVQEFRKYLAERPDADDRKDVERELEDLSGKP